MKTVLLGVSWLGWGHPVLPAGPAASRGLTLSPPLSASETPVSLLPGMCGHLLATWGSGNHLGGQGLGLSRSPQAQGQLPSPLDKGCSRLCFSGVTKPDAFNPPAGPDLQWLWGLPGLDARLQASKAAAKGGGAGIFSPSRLLSGSRAIGVISLGILHSWLDSRVL